MIRKTIDVPYVLEDNDGYIDTMKHLMGEIHSAYPGYTVTVRVTRVRKRRKR